MFRLRASRATLFLSFLLVLAASLIFLSPHGHLTPSHDDPAHPPFDLGLSGQNSWLNFISQSSSALFQSVADLPGLQYGTDGLVRGWEDVHELVEHGGVGLKKKDRKRLKEVRDRHPIETLIELGKQRWETLLARQSKTLPQAVTEYTRRYNRAPPKGFEEWWQFCKRNKVRIVDDYDQINRDIEPFLALSPELFRRRLIIRRVDLSPTTESILSGERAVSVRAKALFNLLEPIAQYFYTDVTFYGSDHDMGKNLLGDDQRQAALEAVREGRFLTEMDLKGYEKTQGRVAVGGLASACPEGSPAWNRSLDIQEGRMVGPLTERETTFIYDHQTASDFCVHPRLTHLHGALSFDTPRDTVLRPLFQYSKLSLNPEFLTTPLEAFANLSSSAAQEKYSPWEEKTVNKLFWRGSGTGDAYSKRKNYNWRQSHRTRLALMAQRRDGDEEVWVKRGREWEKEKWGVGKLNEAYLDVGMSGKPHQCKQEDGTCDEMASEIKFLDRVPQEKAAQYKYVFDVDGNGWSSRFHRLLSSGSVVLKSTIYPEWYSDWMIPWYHYIPCKVDYSDIYHIMSFFSGSPEGRVAGRDDLAREIAMHGREFTEEFWRWEDMQAYMFRLLLEYARLTAPDRQTASYHKSYT
ncbi:hypothetical protein TREMEDRAFT_63970 [Tremella mesenterica DSM 1558]|uniref:uncharacterized protein n=1 Tax=Tremella mesenterica (strain ATCC 24925 / CBS 8224 / DSM 1558 / NBRC 9311 / NRRL Y-6157 / RJB 2259-6 / UBC 559-6) TaxID=578456 RepID=UPI0003F4968C|nr:uncharacterized protein TREMEDRAFT_63970 [Tremella mesenterica DSM 1558]EIW68082.1 hypothetical protein TREMEDRAFT_63970 [Tremella mesenterica DSM 1558]